MLGLGHARFAVVGHDIGCMAAFALAAAHPEAVERLVLSEAWLPGFGLEEGMDVARGGLWCFGFHMQAAVAEALTRGRERYYLNTVALGGMPAAHADLFVRAYERPGRMRAGFEHYATLLRDGEEFRSLVASRGPISAPVLALGGDRSMPMDRLADAARRAARDVRVATVPGGHWFPLEHPREASAALLEFLGPG